MNPALEDRLGEYQRWRDAIGGAIASFRDWLEARGEVDLAESLRLFDLVESLRQDRITLAFVAEFSRGKTELINALFFADAGGRLLPSDAGRTTLCPTEIFYDPAEPPYLRLLPIETRYRDESIRQLKKKPVEWVSCRLEVGDAEQMREVFAALSEAKRVEPVEARTLGLWDENDPLQADRVDADGRVEIPKWRHALVNYPHPLLASGLSLLDTPGLNALGAEPELTLSTIPNAHAVFFLLAADTGVTRSDMEIWQKYIRPYAAHTTVVLNKIDVLWDELRSWEKVQQGIERQRIDTAAHLGVAPERVLALSAHKALLARVRGDETLLYKSGIAALEERLVGHIVPQRREILRQAVTREIGGMVLGAYKSTRAQLDAVRAEKKELAALSGKNREAIRTLLATLSEDKRAYEETVTSYNATRGVIIQQGRILLANLSLERMDAIFQKAHAAIQGSWTTAGLMRGMRSLMHHAMRQFEHIHTHAARIKGLVDGAYLRFHARHGLPRCEAPPLDLEGYRQAFQDLGRRTEAFCKDPVNVLTEKHFLVRRFFLGLVAEARNLFESARQGTEAWLRNALAPLNGQIRDHRMAIERRIENIRKIHDNIDGLEERLSELALHEKRLARDVIVLAEVLSRLSPAANRADDSRRVA